MCRRTGELVDLFVSALEAGDHANLNRTVDALESFARFYNRGRDHGDELELDLDAYRHNGPVSANLVPPNAYSRALARLSGDADRDATLVLTLAFRTGARLPEIMGLQVGDFVEGRGRLELMVQENEGRALKTKTSRRILPLDVLLDDDERDRLAVRLGERRALGRTLGDTFVFGSPGATAPPPTGPMLHQIEVALQKACGSDRIRFAHLRHSFATYLLATLLLPQDVAEPLVPDELAPVISPRRFARVVDRLLGKGRLGSGSVHAVSQVMGHTGPATTLRSYCHLMDLCLGLLVGRPSALPPVSADWLRERLDVTPDARRKVIARLPALPERAVAHRPGRPSPASLLRSIPNLAQKLGDAKLLETGADRIARGVRRAQAAKIDDVAFGKPYKNCVVIGQAPRARCRARQPEQHVVPWTLMIASLSVSGPASGIDGRIVEQWRADAVRLGASDILDVAGQSFGNAVPQDRALRLRIDRWLSLPRALRRPERVALLAAISSLRRDRSHVRLKRLSDARGFVGLLATMGFSDDEIGLVVTNRAGRHLSSAQLHAFLRGSDIRHPLATRQGWTGSLVVRLRPSEMNGPRRAWQAAWFALVMLAIDTGGDASGAKGGSRLVP